MSRSLRDCRSFKKKFNTGRRRLLVFFWVKALVKMEIWMMGVHRIKNLTRVGWKMKMLRHVHMKQVVPNGQGYHRWKFRMVLQCNVDEYDLSLRYNYKMHMIFPLRLVSRTRTILFCPGNRHKMTEGGDRNSYSFFFFSQNARPVVSEEVFAYVHPKCLEELGNRKI